MSDQPVLVTPRKGQQIILRHLRSRYPRVVWEAIRRGKWHVYCQHVLVISDTTFSVATDQTVQHADGSVTEPPRVDVDVLAGTCTCDRLEDGDPCAHLFAAMIWAQMSALDRAYRAVHPNTCRRHWCASRRSVFRLLCETHDRELRRRLEWEELKELRGWRALVDLDAILDKFRRGDLSA